VLGIPSADQLAQALAPIVQKAVDEAAAKLAGQVVPALREQIQKLVDTNQLQITVTTVPKESKQ